MSTPSTGPELDRRRLTAAAIDLIVPLAGVAATTLAGLSLTRGMLLVILAWTLYYFFALESGDGQTLGKRAMNLRVVSADGGQPTMEQIAKRTLVRVVDGPIVGLIAMLATGERRARVGDIIAGTVVTDAGSAAAVDADPERWDLEPDPDPAPEPAFAAPVAAEQTVEEPPPLEAPVAYETDAAAQDLAPATSESFAAADDPYGPHSLAELGADAPAAEADRFEFEPYGESEAAPQVAAGPDADARLEHLPEYSVEEVAPVLPEYSVEEVAPDLPEYSVEEVHEDPPLEPSYVQTGEVDSGVESSTRTVRSIEPVSAIDLVMEESDRERPPVD